ncbi:SLOG family protein [[Kitasatospora] papulosa]|jgi:hypothetical protein|uniref:SLOG family protein n=1 Tax=[Kitasatospora] papulosa TaxID=1464011 RepID=UPI0037D2B76C
MTDTYRILVTGSRDWSDMSFVYQALAQAVQGIPADTITVVHGACPTGADAMAHRWARAFGASSEPHPAQWRLGRRFNRAAGPQRNAAMVRLGADLCRAFIRACSRRDCRYPDPHGSHGATQCADLAKAAGIPVRRWTA